MNNLKLILCQFPMIFQFYWKNFRKRTSKWTWNWKSWLKFFRIKRENYWTFFLFFLMSRVIWDVSETWGRALGGRVGGRIRSRPSTRCQPTSPTHRQLKSHGRHLQSFSWPSDLVSEAARLFEKNGNFVFFCRCHRNATRWTWTFLRWSRRNNSCTTTLSRCSNSSRHPSCQVCHFIQSATLLSAAKEISFMLT